MLVISLKSGQVTAPESLCHLYSKITFREFPGGPVVRLCASTAGGMGSIPGQGNKIPQAARCSQKKKLHFSPPNVVKASSPNHLTCKEASPGPHASPLCLEPRGLLHTPQNTPGKEMYPFPVKWETDLFSGDPFQKRVYTWLMNI